MSFRGIGRDTTAPLYHSGCRAGPAHNRRLVGVAPMTRLLPSALIAAAVLAVLGILAAGAASRAADPPALNPAQTLVFATNHLAQIKQPVTLDYAFRHEGAGAFTDKIALSVKAVHADGSKDVAVEFLSGKRRTDFPPVRGFHGNPLIMYFLEWDVRGMQKAIGGSALYFRNRIRNAFAGGAQVGKVSITLDGHPAMATAIVLRPYRDDPDIARYAAFRDKSYRFVLSDEVPGMVYEISTSVPAAPGAPVEADRAVFSGMRQ